MSTASVRIVGVPFRIDLSDPSAEPTVCRGLAGFEGTGPMPHVIRVRVDDRPLFQGTRGMPQLEPIGGGFRVTGEDFEARISAHFCEAEVRTALGAFGVHSVMKLILGAVLARFGGVVCHGVGVAHEGRAALFVGNSGAGKSTLGALAMEGGLTLLSDELVALTPDSVGFRVHATPWNIGAPGSARLVAIGTLGWDSTHHVEAVPAGEVLRVLLGNTLLPTDDADLRHRMVAILERVFRSARPVRLFFARDPRVADTLRIELAR